MDWRIPNRTRRIPSTRMEDSSPDPSHFSCYTSPYLHDSRIAVEESAKGLFSTSNLPLSAPPRSASVDADATAAARARERTPAAPPPSPPPHLQRVVASSQASSEAPPVPSAVDTAAEASARADTPSVVPVPVSSPARPRLPSAVPALPAPSAAAPSLRDIPHHHPLRPSPVSVPESSSASVLHRRSNRNRTPRIEDDDARGGANETRVRSRVHASLSRARVVDRSIDRVSMPPFASRPSLTPVLARTRQSHRISSHSIPFKSSRGRAVPSRPRAHRLDGPARAPFHVHKHHPVDQTKNNHHTRKKKKYTHIKNRTGGAPPRPRARARRLDASIDRARIVLARSGDVDSSSRRDASLERDAFGRSTRRVRWTRATEEARGCVAREWDGARERRARCERARDGSRGAKGSRRGKGRRNAIEERARDAFVDRSGTIRGGRRLDGMKSNEEHSRFVRSNARPTNAGRGMDANDGERREMGD